MSSTTTNLKNINFMSESKYNSLTEIHDDELYAVKVNGLDGEQLINQNPNEDPVKVWTGTQEEYDALSEYDASTIYNITDGVGGDTIATTNGNNTFTGDNTFSGDVVFEGTATFNNAINGTCSRAVADGDGNSFATTYSKINQPATVLTYSSTVRLLTNKIYTLTLSGNVTFSLPQATAGVLNQIEVQLYMPSVYTINLGTTTYFGGEAPDISEAGYYTLIYEYDPISSTWVVGALKKGGA